MYTYYITHIHCGMRMHIHGYSFSNACKRANIDPELWELEDMDYED